MILIIGGIAQGKKMFAVKQFLSGAGENGFMLPVCPEKPDDFKDLPGAADGRTASWPEFIKASFAFNLHLMIRRRLEAGEPEEKLEAEMAEQLKNSLPDRILITDEIGYGIVPTDAFERRYRELTGRICCRLAADAEEVWRVTAGIGVKLQGKAKKKEGINMAENIQGIPGVNEQKIEGSVLEEIGKQTRQVVREFLEAANMKKGQILVVGCSSSEIESLRIGSFSSREIGERVYQVIAEECKSRGLYLAAQCCEHLNRALILEEEAAELYGYEPVNVVPQLKAGGSFATAAYQGMEHPTAVERIQAHGGIDIGDTLIGMHLRPVAVPVRTATKQIGGAHVVCARVRPKFIGGVRAQYDESRT